MTTQPTTDDLFDSPITYPDVGARERLHRLVWAGRPQDPLG